MKETKIYENRLKHQVIPNQSMPVPVREFTVTTGGTQSTLQVLTTQLFLLLHFMLYYPGHQATRHCRWVHLPRRWHMSCLGQQDALLAHIPRHTPPARGISKSQLARGPDKDAVPRHSSPGRCLRPRSLGPGGGARANRWQHPPSLLSSPKQTGEHS